MKWVYAQFLDEQWSNQIPSEALLPEIIGNLIYASVPGQENIKQFRIPIGNSSRIAGYDGLVEVTDSHQHQLPVGFSVWEFKTSADYEKEANSDLKKRSDKPRGIDKSKTVFVFVSSRKWKKSKKSKEQWVAEKKAEYPEWFDIKFLDAVDLENWFDNCPAVSAAFAKRVDLRPIAGAKSLDEFWDIYSNQSHPSLTSQILLAGRADQIDEALIKLSRPNSSHYIQADSVEEVIAFIVAVIETRDANQQAFLKARTLILEDNNARDFFSTSKGMVFILKPTVAHASGFLERNNTLIIPKGRATPSRNYLALNRPSSYQLAENLETLGFGREEALRVAKESGGSITIFIRRRYRIEPQPPSWTESHNILIPALLAGAWDDHNNYDRKILETLTGITTYSNYEEQLIPASRLEDSPIEKEASIWKLIAPVDAFLYLGPLLATNHYGRLKNAVTEVFSEIHPALTDPSPDEPVSNFFNQKKPKYSDWLRDGLATTLLQIAVLHKEINLTLEHPQAFVDNIIANLPGLRDDPRVIMSLKDELPMLMEAAPDPLVSALEQMLEGTDDKLVGHFFTESDDFFSSSHHYNLLWGLETIAWDPTYIQRACLILAKLVKLDPGGKTTNRPINSLKEIFLLWHPNTNASLNQRLLVLDEIIKQEPEIAWQLIENLLPEFNEVSHNTHKPIYRQAGFGPYETITWQKLWQSQEELLRRSFKLAQDMPKRWLAILDSMSNLKSELRDEIIATFSEHIKKIEQQSKLLELWNLLRDLVSRHRAFPQAKWTFTEQELERLTLVLDEIEPASLIEKYKWLFDSFQPRFFRDELDESWEISKARKDAIDEIYRADDLSGIKALAKAVKEPGLLASCFVDYIQNASIIVQLIRITLGEQNELTFFCRCLSAQVKRSYSDIDWPNIILKLAQENTWKSAEIAELVLGWNDVRETWNFVDSLGYEVSTIYWSRKWALGIKDLEPLDIQYSIGKLLEHNRALSALEVIHNISNRFQFELIKKILEKAIKEINSLESKNNTMLIYYIQTLFDDLVQRTDVDETEIAYLEYSFLPAFESLKRPLTLHKILSKSPELYVQLISDVYKPDNLDVPPLTEELMRKAEISYKLLKSFETIPGIDEKNNIDLNYLRMWIIKARNLSKQKYREEVTLARIGNLLAHSPEDNEDKAWPVKAVRFLIEELQSEHLEKGILLERFNMRGVYSKGVYEGGKQEREIAQQYYDWASLCDPFPRTQTLLRRIASNYEMDAEDEDSRAKLYRMKN